MRENKNDKNINHSVDKKKQFKKFKNKLISATTTIIIYICHRERGDRWWEEKKKPRLNDWSPPPIITIGFNDYDIKMFGKKQRQRQNFNKQTNENNKQTTKLSQQNELIIHSFIHSHHQFEVFLVLQILSHTNT